MLKNKELTSVTTLKYQSDKKENIFELLVLKNGKKTILLRDGISVPLKKMDRFLLEIYPYKKELIDSCGNGVQYDLGHLIINETQHNQMMRILDIYIDDKYYLTLEFCKTDCERFEKKLVYFFLETGNRSVEEWKNYVNHVRDDME